MMNRTTRRAINLLANRIEDGAKALVTWLRANAERERPPKPLAFPTPMEEMLDRIMNPMVDRLARQMADDILRSPMWDPKKVVRITGLNGPDVFVMNRIPDDGSDWRAR